MGHRSDLGLTTRLTIESRVTETIRLTLVWVRRCQIPTQVLKYQLKYPGERIEERKGVGGIIIDLRILREQIGGPSLDPEIDRSKRWVKIFTRVRIPVGHPPVSLFFSLPLSNVRESQCRSNQYLLPRGRRLKTKETLRQRW